MAISRQEDLKNFTHYIDNDETKEGMLVLDDKEITDNIILSCLVPYLTARPNVKKVSLLNNQITNNGAVILSGIGTLRELYLGGNKIGSNGAFALSKHKSLEALTLDDNAIRDDGLKGFEANRTLKSLSVNRCMITDKGVIDFLAPNRSITFLSLSGNKITEAGVKMLDVNPVIERRFIDGFSVTANTQVAGSHSEIIDEQQELKRSLHPEDSSANDELTMGTIVIPVIEERITEEDDKANVLATQPAQGLSTDEATTTVATIIPTVEPASPQAIVAEIVGSGEPLNREDVILAPEPVNEAEVVQGADVAVEENNERAPGSPLTLATAVLDTGSSATEEYMAVIAEVDLAGEPGALPYFPDAQELTLLMRPHTPSPVPASQPANLAPVQSRQDTLSLMYADSVKEIIPKYETAAEMYKELALLSLQEYTRYLQSIALSYLQDKLLGKSAFNVAIRSREQYLGTDDEAAKRILLSYLVLYMKQLAKRESANSTALGWMTGKPDKTSKQNAATRCLELLSDDYSLENIDLLLDESKEHKSALNDSSMMGLSEGDLSVFRKQIKWAMDPKNRELPQLRVSPRK